MTYNSIENLQTMDVEISKLKQDFSAEIRDGKPYYYWYYVTGVVNSSVQNKKLNIEYSFIDTNNETVFEEINEEITNSKFVLSYYPDEEIEIDRVEINVFDLNNNLLYSTTLKIDMDKLKYSYTTTPPKLNVKGTWDNHKYEYTISA